MRNYQLAGSYLQKKPEQQLSEALSDEQLLQRELEGVVPLKYPATSDSKKPPRGVPKIRRSTSQANNHSRLSELAESDAQLSIDSDHTHRKNGVQNRMMQKLKRGHYPPEDECDLHHLNTRTGKSALLEFISWACQQNFKCIRIVHGKGLRSLDGPKLKHMSRDVLRAHPQVMAFTACKQNEGGDGATDVLLKS